MASPIRSLAENTPFFRTAAVKLDVRKLEMPLIMVPEAPSTLVQPLLYWAKREKPLPRLASPWMPVNVVVAPVPSWSAPVDKLPRMAFSSCKMPTVTLTLKRPKAFWARAKVE